MTHVLVIEDEGAIASAVADRLRGNGFSVEIAVDGPSGLTRSVARPPDLVVLDLMLPGMDGLEVCRRLQRESHVPVLMLTARDEEADMLVGLGIGADDYMTKPFSPRELVAPIRAILRRATSDPPTDGLQEFGAVTLDRPRRRVHRNGVEVHLTATEFDLLASLAQRPGTVLSRRQLLIGVWGWSDEAAERTVDSHIRSIRHKLGQDLIRTVHGVGYALEADDGR